MHTNASEWLRLLGWAVVALILVGLAFARAPWRAGEEAGQADTTHSQVTECFGAFEDSATDSGCPAANFEVGSCYHEESLASYRHASCGTPYATVRMTKRINGVTDESECSEDTYRIITISSPRTTFCLSRP